MLKNYKKLILAVNLTAAGRYFMTINYFVHSLMYTYYAVTAYGIRMPRFVAMSVTSLQTIQMFVGMLLALSVATLKIMSKINGHNLVCQQTDSNLVLCFFIYFTFAILFMKFFSGSYLNKKPKAVLSKTKAVLSNGFINKIKMSNGLCDELSNCSAKPKIQRKDKYA